MEAAKPTPWKPAADGPQATVGPHLGFQVKDEVSIGLGFDCATVSVMVVVKRSAAGRKEGKRMLSDRWIKESKRV